MNQNDIPPLVVRTCQVGDRVMYKGEVVVVEKVVAQPDKDMRRAFIVAARIDPRTQIILHRTPVFVGADWYHLNEIEKGATCQN